MAKKFEEMTKAEREVAFEKWVAGRTERRGISKIKRAATQALIAAHPDEYNELIVKAGGTAAKK